MEPAVSVLGEGSGGRVVTSSVVIATAVLSGRALVGGPEVSGAALDVSGWADDGCAVLSGTDVGTPGVVSLTAPGAVDC